MPRALIHVLGVAVAAGAAVAAAGCELQQPLTLSCTTQPGEILDVVQLHPQRGHATLLSVSPSRTGSVQVSPTEYAVTFEPGVDGASRLRLTINRYTFRSSRQEGGGGGAGVAPGSTLNGVCERYRARPL